MPKFLQTSFLVWPYDTFPLSTPLHSAFCLTRREPLPRKTSRHLHYCHHLHWAALFQPLHFWDSFMPLLFCLSRQESKIFDAAQLLAWKLNRVEGKPKEKPWIWKNNHASWNLEGGSYWFILWPLRGIMHLYEFSLVTLPPLLFLRSKGEVMTRETTDKSNNHVSRSKVKLCEHMGAL